MNKKEQAYLMIGGTLLPAFIGVGAISLMTKKPITMKNSTYIMAFAGLSIAGGFLSARMIEGIKKNMSNY